jgi:hypothetical protein
MMCVKSIISIPNLKCAFDFLCRNVYIATRPPISPPMSDKPNNIASRIRERLRTAFHLSTAKKTNVIMFIMNKYMSKPRLRSIKSTIVNLMDMLYGP